MADAVRDFFESLPSRVDPAKTAGFRNSYVFDIEGVGQWTVHVADGDVRVSEGAESADCTIGASEETFRKLVAGEQSAMSAYMAGKLRVQGDMGAAMKLKNLF